MNSWLRRNNKRLLAFFGVFLMIAFLLPASFGPGQGRNQVVGEVHGSERVYIGALETAWSEWGYLKTSVLLPSGGGRDADGVPLPENVPLLMFSRAFQSGHNQIEEHKALYYLLQQEAARLGIRPTPEQVENLLEHARIKLPDGREVAYSDPRLRDSRQGAFTRQAVTNLLAVDNAFNRAISAVKVSEPARSAWMARQLQALDLGYVVFPSADFAGQVATPTAAELADHFSKFADRLPGEPTDENPFGFGYKFPNRLKLQYIVVTRDQLRRAVLENPQLGETAQAREHHWQKEAYKYFLRNREQFATTQPATQPEAGPLSLPGGSATPASSEAEFTDAVRQIAMDRLVEPEIEALLRKVQGRLTAALNTDYANYSRAKSANQPAPATPFQATYDSFDYLQNLANEVQSQFGVLPTVVNLGDEFRGQAELRNAPGLATVFARIAGRPMDLAGYAFSASAAFADPEARERPTQLDLFEPSQVMSDMLNGGLLIFRISAADASHRPASVDEVAAQVEADLRRLRAYELAQSAAQTLIVSAAFGDLASTAAAAGRTFHTANDLRIGQRPTLEGVAPLHPFAVEHFSTQAFDLLADAGSTTHPAARQLAVIDLQPVDVALAAELLNVRGDLPAEMVPMVEAQMARQLVSEIAAPAALAWFNWDNVVRRTGFTGPSGR